LKLLQEFILTLSMGLLFTQYGQAQTIICDGGFVDLVVGMHRGEIQWEISLDGSIWMEIPDAAEDSVRILPDTTAFYRARVMSEDCDPIYSDVDEIEVESFSSFTFEMNSNVICEGQELIVNASGADMYQFLLDGHSLGELSNENTASIPSVKNGQILRVFGFSESGCSSSMATQLNVLGSDEFELEQENILPFEAVTLRLKSPISVKEINGTIGNIEVNFFGV